MRIFIAIATLMLACGNAPADVPPAQRAEVEHLIAFVRETECRIERNGKYYDGLAAVKHIEKKYAYFRDDIESTEDFIRLAASRSTLSGRAYTVICGDAEPIETQAWLLQELESLRSGG